MKRNGVLQAIVDFVEGAIVGVGAILPGVSGGVLSVAFGVYEPMMELLTTPDARRVVEIEAKINPIEDEDSKEIKEPEETRDESEVK